MSARLRWWRTPMVALVAGAMSLATAAVAAPSATASPAGTAGAVRTVPVQQLSSRLIKLMKAVEDAPLACDTRNTLVRRLRLVDDALVSGRPSAAKAFAFAWTRNAWSLQSAGVIPPGLGGALQTQLGGMVDQIGSGWSDKPRPTRHWKPLPSCDTDPGATVASGGAVAGSSAYVPYAATNVSSDIEIVVGALVSYVPVVGNLLYALTYLLWPAGSTTDTWSKLARTAIYNLVAADLGMLKGLMSGSEGSWNDQMTKFTTLCPNWSQTQACIDRANGLFSNFRDSKNDFFITYRSAFQDILTTPNGHTVTGLDLLPLFVQYETMYLSLLRDAMLLHDHYWVNVPNLDPDDLAGSSMADELNLTPTNPARMTFGVHYVDSMYEYGLGLEPSSSATNWAARNVYIRTETLTVLDYRNLWKYMDPRAYPDGVPGGVKLTRMIYSDPVGAPLVTPNLPSNVAGPLKETSLWTQRVDGPPGVSHLYIDAAQATNPPLLGPARSGAITGDTTQPANHVHWSDLSSRGPITKVSGVMMEELRQTVPVGYFPEGIRFDYANGTNSTAGDLQSGQPSCRDKSGNLILPQNFACSTNFHYDGEAVANVQAISVTQDSLAGSDGQADSVVFGFRYADSFDPAGEVLGVDSSRCLDVQSLTNEVQAQIRTCAQPPLGTQIWTYDPGLEQIAVTNTAVNPADNLAHLQDKYCLDTSGGATASNTPVVITKCDDGAQVGTTKSSQRWRIAAVGAGIATITNVRSGMVLAVSNSSTADGAGLVIAPYAGTRSQQWKASDPSTGEIHGIGSGRCVDVPNASITAGTTVQIYDCKGNNAQQWTYNPSYKMFFYAHAPSLCLTARGGGTTPDTPVEINTCTGAAEQRWTVHSGGGTITNDKSGLPLLVPHGYTANNTMLNIDTANDTAMQQWSRTSTQGGPLYPVGAAGKCLTAPQSGSTVEIAPCYSPPTPAQIWTYHPTAQTFTAPTASGPKCLDAPGAGTTPGTVVIMNSCSGAVTQRWQRDFSDATITNVATITQGSPGLVLDISYAVSASGTLVLSNPVTPVPATQKWVWSLS